MPAARGASVAIVGCCDGTNVPRGLGGVGSQGRVCAKSDMIRFAKLESTLNVLSVKCMRTASLVEAANTSSSSMLDSTSSCGRTLRQCIRSTRWYPCYQYPAVRWNTQENAPQANNVCRTHAVQRIPCLVPMHCQASTGRCRYGIPLSMVRQVYSLWYAER